MCLFLLAKMIYILDETEKIVKLSFFITVEKNLKIFEFKKTVNYLNFLSL